MTNFRELHVPGTPLLLANAWDAGSARVVAATGVPAIATTSAGVAWSLGAIDGDDLGRAAAIAVVERVVAVVDVPVTADIEGGFGDDAEGVAETIRGVVAAGAAGINIEDAGHGRDTALLAIEEMAERIAAARSVSPELFINARVDTFLRGNGDLDDTFARAAAYIAAGADGVFVPGTGDLAVIETLVKGIDAPVNVLVGPGSPTVAELASVGVARVSLGSGVAQAAYAVARKAALELAASGTYDSVADAINYGELNAR
ncbi:2-methylisocitrate lyase [Actinorhabdospora filicis]|uniref:2-methylisocitrate lyase n=1 Tax=Actinorhabdospora filicis TaxID=1785913 RepID=A0A9W6SNX5_9ACTN|nr:isocitrate lyase/phosphoenolpyruvate mutase family protein [Actinorhabdospora filicis]GLZ80335.1 2-methylisocitrate lyase [Actinorhabdospora filicis]